MLQPLSKPTTRKQAHVQTQHIAHTRNDNAVPAVYIINDI